jgi:2-polyprenyl-6-methoxyphenol hydroxylase-like FAD-dependent oxidoreductase
LRPIPEIDAQTAEVAVAQLTNANAKTHPELRAKPYTVDRTLLREVLLRGLEGDVSYGKQFERYELLENGVKAYFIDGSTAEGTLLVGADGKNSNVRKQYLPNHIPQDTSGRCIYGRTPMTPDLVSIISRETLNGMAAVKDRSRPQLLTTIIEAVTFPNRQAIEEEGFSCPEDYIYWLMAAQPSVLGLSVDEGPDLQHITGARAESIATHLAETWHPSLKCLITHQSPNCTAILPIKAFPAKLPYRETNARITLLGDAAHLMGPTAGSGAIMALRDCHELVRRLVSNAGTRMEETVGAYEEEMRAYAGSAIGLSWEAGKNMSEEIGGWG